MPQPPSSLQVSNLSVGEALRGERILLLGTLAGFGRREVQERILAQGGEVLETPDDCVTLVVVGECGDPPADAARFNSENPPRVQSEREFLEQLELLERETAAPGLYTAAMVAELVGVSRSLVRRWQSRGWLIPVGEVRRLAYFDFQQVAIARTLAELVAAKCTPQAIEKQLTSLSRFASAPGARLEPTSVVVQGKQLLLRRSSGLLDHRGQLRLDFTGLDFGGALDFAGSQGAEGEEPATDAEAQATAIPENLPEHASRAQLQEWGAELEEAGQLEEAVEMYRAALVAGEPDAELNFTLAELLYRIGDLSAARERYYMAIELNEDYVEARANLGCVLAETGQKELAAAAFRGALLFHENYPDVHYHLARTLDELQRREEAETHWQAFLDYAPGSPWAEEARARLRDAAGTG